MAEYELIVRDGRKVRLYQSGLELDDQTGRILKPAAHTLITTENSTAYHRARQEKTAARVRDEIVRATNSGLLPAGTPPVRESADAIGAAMGMLWEEVVMNSEAYPRDRKEMLELVGRTTGDLPAPGQPAGSDPDAGARLAAMTAAANVEAARILAKVFADVKQAQADTPQAIEGKVTG